MMRCNFLTLLVCTASLFAVGIRISGAASTNAPVAPAKPTASVSSPAASATSAQPPPATVSLSLPVATDTKSTVVANPDMVCPVLPEDKADVKYSKVYEGKIYYFCCARCLVKFSNDPKPYVAALENKATVYTVAAHQESAASESTEAATATTSDSGSINASAAATAASGPELSTEERLVRFIGLFHPLLVHFPIALLFVAAFAEFLFGFTGRHFFAPISLFCVRLGAMMAVITAIAGWAAATGGSGPADTAWILDVHRWLGIATAAAAVLAAVISLWIERDSERGFYRWTLYVIAVLVGVTGHFGGMLVYGANYLKW